MSTYTFYNPDLVAQLEAAGITARRRQELAGTPTTRGFVLAAAPRPGGRGTTHVIAAHANVTITGPQPQLPAGETRRALPAPATTTATEPRTALELAEDCARLRRDNQRLTDEVARLRAEVARLTGGPAAAQPREPIELDDSARRFSLLELD